MWQPGISLDDAERQVILKALTFYRGNRTRTADALEIALKTLRTKLKRYKKEGHAIPTFPGEPGDEKVESESDEKPEQA